MKEVIKASGIKKADMTKVRLGIADEINVMYDNVLRMIDSGYLGVAQRLMLDFGNHLTFFRRLGFIDAGCQAKLEIELKEDMEKKVEEFYKRIGE